MSYKILLIGSSSTVGLTFHFTRLALALKKAGNEVHTLSDSRQQYADLPRELAEVGIRRYVSDAVDRAGPISMVKGAKDIRTIFKKENGFDIIHAGGVKHIVKVFLTTRRRKNKRPKTLATVGSLPRLRIGMVVAAMSYNCFIDKCVALSNCTKRKLQTWCVNPERISVIPLFAPDLEWFDGIKKAVVPLEDYNLEDVAKPVVFYAASHFHFKGFSHYLLAASEVLKKIDATFVVGGQGPLTESLRDLARRIGIHKHIIFTGWISNYHMPYILSNIADVCLSTSLMETLSSYVMECMAAGKPVVASGVGIVPEIIKNGVNGYIILPRDHIETANRIMELLDNPKRVREWGFAGRKIIEEQFNMKASTEKLMKVFEELVER